MIGVIAVRHGFVLATAVVRAAAVCFLAVGGIGVADFDTAFIYVRIMNRVQMPVVQKIRVIAVFDSCMPAVCAVFVRMVVVCRMCHKIFGYLL